MQTPETQSQQFYIQTFGCQMNVADTERMEALLSEQGLTRAQTPQDAQVIIVNGCSVREKAVHKALSTLGRYQFLKNTGDPQDPKATRRRKAQGLTLPETPKTAPIIGVGGCVGQLDKDGLFAQAPYIDFVFGPDAIDQLPEMVHRARSGEKNILETEFDPSKSYSTETKIMDDKAIAFVNIMKGCDKYCTYCIVPYTRGREKSRTIQEVLDDLAQLVGRGVREVTLLGQNVNSFGKGNPNSAMREPQELHNVIGKVGPKAGDENFPQLLRAIESDPRLQEIKRIRFTSSHPLDFSDELIECYQPKEKGGVSRLSPHLHLPVQSGSDRVLQKMGRHHQIAGYIAQMDRLREICPEVGISTDLIVGFPGETEADFEQTLALLDRVQYDHVYAFMYSVRPGTRAEKLVDDVPQAVKATRLNRLLAHQAKISERHNARLVGTVREILVEGPSKHENLVAHRKQQDAQHGLPSAAYAVWTGRTGCNRVVNFITRSPRNLKGQFVRIKIESASALALQAHWEPELSVVDSL